MMGKVRLSVFLSILLSSLGFLTSCETDVYEKGTGKYSLMLTDLAEVTVDDQKTATAFTTDDGDSYIFSPAITAKWIQTADTIYRAIVYYNKNTDGTAKPLGLGTVPTLIPREHSYLKDFPNDPIGFESVWVSGSRKYINLGLLVRSGQTDDKGQKHTIALLRDTIYTSANQKQTAVYRLLHDQGGVPEYYTDRHYVSILLPDTPPDTVLLYIQTYQGEISRKLKIKD
jgi:hypothetical protein